MPPTLPTILRPAAAGAAAAVSIVSALVAGVGWYYSTLLLRPDRVVRYPDRVLVVRDGQVWLAPSQWAELSGEWGLRWDGGFAVVGPVLPAGPVLDASAGVAGAVRRALLSGSVPPDDTAVVFDAGPHDPDPAVLGLDFATVPVPTALGACPAWLVPAADSAGPGGDTWVIAVHGRGADRRECLRVLPELHRLGYPVLAASYRNDVDAPASPDGYYHLGDTEWEDLDAAAAYALDGGARRLVLFGWSMGAAIIGAYLDRAASAGAVSAVVWDCPLLDWRVTLRQQAALRGLPPAFTRLATAFIRARIGIDFDRFDLLTRPPSVRPPTLVFHGAADTAVPIGTTRALATAAAELDWPLRYVEMPGAEHTASWNVDPDGYLRALADFLTEHAGPAERAQPTSNAVQWHDGLRD